MWLLFFVALMGISMAGTGTVVEVGVRREKELELLRIGDEIRRAIADYYNNTPQAAKELPSGLPALLEDKRGLVMRRHLRRLYVDPMTGKQTWGLATDATGRLLGVYSLAAGRPIRRAGFGAGLESFENAESYADWRFVAPGINAQAPPPATPPGERAAIGAIQPATPAAPGTSTPPVDGTPAISGGPGGLRIP